MVVGLLLVGCVATSHFHCTDFKSSATGSSLFLFAYTFFNEYATNLTAANLFSASMVGIRAKRAVFRNANMQAANLTEADLSQADSREADLRNANLLLHSLREQNFGPHKVYLARKQRIPS